MMIRRRKVILGALGVAAGVTVAGCSKSGGAAGGSGVAEKPASGTWNAAPATAKAISLSVSPKAGATKVSPTSAVTIAVAGGKLQSCSVVASGDKVTGAMQDDGTWKSTGDLAYDKKYKVTATVVDSLGATVKKTSSFSTLSPSHTARTTFQANGLNALKAGGTYGMGQPIIVAFSHSVTNKAAAEKAISIETTPSVEGKFRWVSSSTVHWRPAKYWAKGTKIKVSVNTFGVHLGNGVYGSSDRSTHFTIGRQLLAVSDNNTHHTKVYIDGKLVRTMASSNGMGGYSKAADGHQLEFWTHGGPHVVLSKEATHSMSSASYGLTDPKNKYYYAPEIVKLCTRISYSGEFLHAAPWNHVLGRANISHGCVNLSVNDAQWVYDNFLIGDVVDVVNSPIKLPVTDGLGDWTVPYSKY
jgi:lipoprotein-anchoring transpeptidase ErfK/SrfK